MKWPWWPRRPRERRRSIRIPVACLEAVYWDGSSNASHILKEVSFDGAVIQTDVVWFEGTMIRLSIRRARTSESEMVSGSFVQMWCRVVRLVPNGLCVEFLFPSDKERRGFGKFLDQEQVRPTSDAVEYRKSLLDADSI